MTIAASFDPLTATFAHATLAASRYKLRFKRVFAQPKERSVKSRRIQPSMFAQHTLVLPGCWAALGSLYLSLPRRNSQIEGTDRHATEGGM
jgi:hypothetical protein